jgi:hypothetical protein
MVVNDEDIRWRMSTDNETFFLSRKNNEDPYQFEKIDMYNGSMDLSAMVWPWAHEAASNLGLIATTKF